MSALPPRGAESTASPQEHLEAVEALIRKHRLVDQMVHRQAGNDTRRPALAWFRRADFLGPAQVPLDCAPTGQSR